MGESNISVTETDLPTVAVLLAAYNGREWLVEQVDSILSQHGVEVTIFVSVDASSDDTEGMVAALARNDSRIKPLPFGRRFGGAGPNFFRLIKECDLDNFDAVALADQDDIWLEYKLARACQMIKDGKADVVSSDVVAFWPCGEKQAIRKSQPQRKFDYFFEAAGPGCTYVFNRASIQAFQKFLIHNSMGLGKIVLHDWLAYAFCRHNGFHWCIDSEPSMMYRQHSSNQVGTNKGFKAILKRLEMVRSHWYRRQVKAISQLVAPDSPERVTSFKFMLKNANQLRRKRSERFALVAMRLVGLF